MVIIIQESVFKSKSLVKLPVGGLKAGDPLPLHPGLELYIYTATRPYTAYSTSGKSFDIDEASKPGLTFQVLIVPSPLGGFLITS
jgi:hypothetical protein